MLGLLALLAQRLKLRLRLRPAGLQLTNHFDCQPREITAQGAQARLGGREGRVIRPVAARHFIHLTLQSRDLCTQLGDTRIVPHARQAQECLGAAAGATHRREVSVQLPDEGLRLLNIRRGLINGHLRFFDHGFQRSGPLPLAETLHGLFSQAHLFPEAAGFLDQKLRGCLGRIRRLLEQQAQILISVSIGQLGRNLRVTRARNHVDQSRQLPVTRLDHPAQRSGGSVNRHRPVFLGIPVDSFDKRGIRGQFQPLGHALGHRIAVQSLDDRVDHVDRTDFIVPHRLHPSIKDLLPLRFDKKNRARPVKGFLPADEENAEDRAEQKTEADQPPPLKNHVQVVAPVERLRAFLQGIEGIGRVVGMSHGTVRTSFHSP